MELESRLEALSEKARTHREALATEEAAKNALVMPFLQALGYDVFNPAEVIPEFTADVGTKKGEKVDYAICVEGEIAMLIECKPVNQELSLKHASQLYRYFSVTDAKFAILTNGAQFKFYSDLEASNRMDQKPFYEFDLCKLRKTDYRNLAKFQKVGFDVDAIVETAESLQMEGAVIKALEAELTEPSADFVRLIASKVVDGRLTPGSKSAISRHIPNAFRAILRDRLNDRLSSAIDEGSDEEPASSSEIETTPDELEGFQLVRAICSDIVDPSRIHMRDAKSYCAILLDDNNRKPLARMWFNSETARYVGTFDEDKVETKHPVQNVVEIYKHKAAIIDRLQSMLAE
ncbi:type I restriction endonuclease [Novosphingopyxis iocasae]|uniref:type I restriction endonuclease n=1 Tax=Novosphingopyxis iocasae TaxID=2762729 RepID=UPI0016513EEB|nr:type I restriction endonuclease [Novosphingopyxis iocasae]